MVAGRCECGKVRFEVKAVGDSVTVCHCSQCRRTSGHLWASTRANLEDLTFHSDEGLVWFASSDFAERGFCRSCGASLFYRSEKDTWISIAAGCLDPVADLHIGRHIFVADKGSYYEICDGNPTFPQD